MLEPYGEDDNKKLLKQELFKIQKRIIYFYLSCVSASYFIQKRNIFWEINDKIKNEQYWTAIEQSAKLGKDFADYLILELPKIIFSV